MQTSQRVYLGSQLTTKLALFVENSDGFWKPRRDLA
jgi:hypothetical protein